MCKMNRYGIRCVLIFLPGMCSLVVGWGAGGGNSGDYGLFLNIMCATTLQYLAMADRNTCSAVGSVREFAGLITGSGTFYLVSVTDERVALSSG